MSSGRMPVITREEAERRGARRRATAPRVSLAWQERAGCAGEDTELFFPPGAGEEFATRIEQAKQICRRCPVRAECLEYALTVPIRHGIFGGLDEVEREPLRRRKPRRAA